MKIRKLSMDLSAVNESQYPIDGLPEIALAGRSNVGKSSLINSLLNRKKFARVSQNPGKTRTINFYTINEEFFLVDLPGYGYAKVSKQERSSWGSIMEKYLQNRDPLCAIMLLVDIRHEPKDDDKIMYDWIKHFGYKCIIIATKADKISRGKYQKHFKMIRNKLGLKDEVIIPISSLKKTGIEETWAEIVKSFNENGYEIEND
ncbi:MAG: ribosome biogenesis GTP-binding protein YihA/YsxC [Peptostreptococcaceae bacterium]|jgi:GTP-binding protein|nr:ribosome biogenesis GTP-binding protein YihA/YsxC [Peptostreptococcaceae bacterium]